MKIMFSIGTMSHGGAQRVISIIADQLIREKHDVEILTYYDEKPWYDLNPKIKLTCDEKIIGKVGILKHIRFRRKYIKQEKPDVVLSFLAPFNMVMIVAMLGLKTPLIVADRNDPKRVPENKYIRKVRDILYNFADSVIVQNNSNKSYFGKKIQAKCDVIFNPIELNGNIGKALNEEKKDKIVAVGRIIKQKNPLLLTEAFCRLASDYPSFSLVFYGEGDMGQQILDYAEQHGLKDRVLCPGPVENVYANICDSKLYVMSSDYEGMPNALLEAMCFGLPVVSTKVSGATDVIIDSENGILVDCSSVDQLEKAMRKMLGDQEFAQSCASEAQKLADKLEKTEVTKQWLSCIRKVRR